MNRFLYGNAEPVGLIDPSGRSAVGYALSALFGANMAHRFGGVFLLTTKLATGRLNEDPKASFQNETYRIVNATATFYAAMFGAASIVSVGKIGGAQIGAGLLLGCLFTLADRDMTNPGEISFPCVEYKLPM
jgi:hypothetical protein